MEEICRKPFILRMPLPMFLEQGKATSKALLMAFLSFSDNGKGTCYAGTRQLANRAGISVGLVSKLKKEFVNNGTIQKVGKRKTAKGWVDEIKVHVHPMKPDVQKLPDNCSPTEPIQLKDTDKIKQQGVVEKTSDKGNRNNPILEKYAEEIIKGKLNSGTIQNPIAYRQSIIRANETQLQEVVDLLKRHRELRETSSSSDYMEADRAYRRADVVEQQLGEYDSTLVDIARKWLNQNTGSPTQSSDMLK